MKRLSDGDPAAVWTLATEFADELRGAVRGRLTRMGRPDLAADEDVLAGLVLDIGFLLQGSAWSPEGGALPWVWAGRAVDQLVSDTVGHRAVSFDEEPRSDAPAAPLLADVADVGLECLAASDPTVRLLDQAITEVASERDRHVHIAYRLQHADGDPSPANTVAAMCDLGAANVRQIDRRVRAKLATLAATDPAYAPLKELAWLA